MAAKFSQGFSVKMQAPEMIVPAEPKPHEMKQLSDIDDQEGLRFHTPLIFFYRNNPTPAMKGKDPVKVIREALSKALVFYYPFAGRLREVSDRKLLVDCNGEGVLFIEAIANFTLDQLGHEIQPPFPYLGELLYNVPGSDGILGCPLLLIQVTRLDCGGFIIAIRWNHTMCDAYGLMQFIKTVEEMIQGALTPSLIPVWQREILNARDPPRITCTHHEYEQLDYSRDTFQNTNPNEIDHKSFYFGPQDIRSLRNLLDPSQLRNCSTFDLITACVWRCRTAALQLDPNQIVRFSCLVNVRNKPSSDIQIPRGYYGNTFCFPAVCSKAELLCRSPLGYAVELLKRAKAKMSGEYMKSTADRMVIKGRPMYTTMENFMVSYITKSGFADVDFGWGKPVYGGTAGATSLFSICMKHQKMDGQSGFLMSMCLPKSTMQKFEEELKKMSQGSMNDHLYMKPTEMISCRL